MSGEEKVVSRHLWATVHAVSFRGALGECPFQEGAEEYALGPRSSSFTHSPPPPSTRKQGRDKVESQFKYSQTTTEPSK